MRRESLQQFPHRLHSLQRALEEEAGGWRARKENTDPTLGPLEVGSADRRYLLKVLLRSSHDQARSTQDGKSRFSFSLTESGSTQDRGQSALSLAESSESLGNN
jgi:hypothetical protein